MSYHGAMMRFSICNELFEGWAWERVCDFAAELGYEGLEVAPFTLAPRAQEVSPIRRRELRRAADARGITIVGLHWLLVTPAGLHFTHPDPQVRRHTAEYFVELAQLCGDLGGKVMVIGSPKQRNLLPGVTTAQAADFAAEVFAPALESAQRLGVTLAFEALSPVDTSFINTVAQAISLADQIGHPKFRINLDVKAMSSETTPIPDIIRSASGWIAHVQVNDPNGRGPGMGDLPFEPILQALNEVGYDGWLSVEAFDFTPGPQRIAEQSIASLKRMGAGPGK
jgi:sugar phosphate isomerase/epimerase